tara:strand:- start:654 stop:818 length:165 start_codon:yes stop_codon:yes gene_type:complete
MKPIYHIAAAVLCFAFVVIAISAAINGQLLGSAIALLGGTFAATWAAVLAYLDR